jgi:type IV pilus assembly protein PilP
MLTKRSIAVLIIAAWALAPVSGFSAEETIRTPSDQMKDAVNKLSKAPATIGSSLQNLTDAAKEKLRETFGGNPAPEPKPAPADLNLPKKTRDVPAAPVRLDGSNRDPFRPMTLKTKITRPTRENLSPLERYDIGQLKLVAIIWDIQEPRAMVEDSAGLGYVVKVGTPIGNNDGKIKTIQRNEVVIQEFYFDDYGARKKRDVAMKLLTE